MQIPKVLIVNDNPATLLAMASILAAAAKRNEYEVLSATSGEDALRKVLNHDFAVILMDVKMPGMDGFETAEAIQSRPSSARVPIIFVTAHFTDEMRRMEGYQTGAVDYLITPVIPKILQTKVSVFVELARQKLELQLKTKELARLNDDLRIQRVQDLERINRELQAEIVDRKRAELHAQELATRDPLTGLINRRSLMEHVEHSIAHSARYEQVFALLFLDLDKFKAINDTFGHDVGDGFLKQIAERIKSSVRQADLVARLGGDEFVVLLKGPLISMKAQQVAEKIAHAIAQPYEIGRHRFNASASIGLAMYPEDGTSSGALMQGADIAMYTAKRTKRGSIYRFDKSLHE
jgi:diguanylate cyclase (GGDEF)-like protein